MSHPGFPLSAPVGLGICVIANLFLKCEASCLSVPAGAAQRTVPVGGVWSWSGCATPSPSGGSPVAADGPGSGQLWVTAPRTMAANLLRHTPEPHRNVSMANTALPMGGDAQTGTRQEAKPPVPLPRSILQSTGTSRAPSTPRSRVPAQEQPRQRQDYHQLHFTDKRPRRGEIKGLILRVTEGVRGCAHGSRHGGHAGRCLIRAEHTGSGLPPPKGPPPQ